MPDQIDEAINYIKSLETKLKMYEEKKESLMGRKRSSPCTNIEATANPRAPQIEVREMGSTLQIVLITRPDNQFLFSEVIHILYEEQAEVLNASYSASGDSILHVVYAEVRTYCFFSTILSVSQPYMKLDFIHFFWIWCLKSELSWLSHVQMERNSFDFGATKVTGRLKGLVYGSTSDVELQPELWDFDIYSDQWNL